MAKSTSADPESIPAVTHFLEMQDRLDTFIQHNEKVMNELAELTELYNDTLQEADEAVRALSVQNGSGISCGPFVFKHFSERVDAEKAFDALDRDTFARLGGAIKQVPSYVIEKRLVVKAIESGEITPEEAKSFYRKTPNYQKINKLVLP